VADLLVADSSAGPDSSVKELSHGAARFLAALRPHVDSISLLGHQTAGR
jgi:hypothetical protein